MALYEAARAVGLTCSVCPLLYLNAPYPEDLGLRYEEEDDEDDLGLDEAFLIGDKFHTFNMLFCDRGQDMSADECKENMRIAYPSKLLDDRKVTWLNQRKTKFVELALVNSVVGHLCRSFLARAY